MLPSSNFKQEAVSKARNIETSKPVKKKGRKSKENKNVE
jgi:hypothetical protein